MAKYRCKPQVVDAEQAKWERSIELPNGSFLNAVPGDWVLVWPDSGVSVVNSTEMMERFEEVDPL